EGDLERRGEGVYDRVSGIGAHEVIVEAPEHDAELGMLSASGVGEDVRAWRDRIADLKRDERFRSVLGFKNRGAEAGATLEHPHSQLIATPVVPVVVTEEMENAGVYYRYRERCLVCDVLRQELDARVRLVIEGPHVVALAPFAARFPFEMWLVPRNHTAAFELADQSDLDDLAAVLRVALRKLDRVLTDPPYNLVLHSAPFGAAESPSYHWHVEIVPKLTGVAGFEIGSGFHINPVPPEDAARFLRDAPAS